MEKQITWQATDSVRSPKSSDWFWILGIFAVSTSVVAILFHNLFFALLVLIASLTLALLAKRTSANINFKLSENGLSVGRELYPWNTIRAFWIDTEATSPLLLVDTTKILAPQLSIPIPKYKAKDVQSLFKKHSKEEELHEPISNKIIEFFGL